MSLPSGSSVVNCSGKMSVFYPGRGRMALVEQLPRARSQILDCYIHHEIDSRQAATLLGVGERQFWRLLAAYRKRGKDALKHGNRGRRPGNAIPPKVAARAVELARDRYPDANHTHLAELLAEREGITISRQTLRRILTAADRPDTGYEGGGAPVLVPGALRHSLVWGRRQLTHGSGPRSGKAPTWGIGRLLRTTRATC